MTGSGRADYVITGQFSKKAYEQAKAVEAGKSKFAGHEILGKTLGVIGLGAIGGMRKNICYRRSRPRSRNKGLT